MASYTTVIKGFSEKENSRTYEISGHTVLAPKLLIQKRKVAATAEASAESQLQVVYGTSDADGNILQKKVVFSADVRYPVNGQASDISAALVVFRDFVASDEFTSLVNSQTYVKE